MVVWACGLGERLREPCSDAAMESERGWGLDFVPLISREKSTYEVRDTSMDVMMLSITGLHDTWLKKTKRVIVVLQI